MGYVFRNTMPILAKVNIIVGCLWFLKLAGIMITKIKVYNFLVWLEKYEFVVYAVHIVILNQILKIFMWIVPFNGLFILIGYFVIIAVGIVISIAFGVVFKRLLPKVYKVMVGYRV